MRAVPIERTVLLDYNTLPMTAAALPTRLWRTYPRETLALALLVAAGAALAGSAWSTPSLGGLGATDEAPPPAPPPLLVRQLAPQDALAVNAGIPISDGPNPAAQPFSLGRADPTARAQALDCLTSAVYYEAGNESADGQRGVAQVVLNRVRHPAFPASVCAVVYQGSTRITGCQFTFTCDGSLARLPGRDGWARAQAVARAALDGYVHKTVGLATHYHANYVVPYWAPTLAKNAVIGTHIFYRWSGGWGRPSAFTQRYAQREANSEALRLAALTAERAEPATAEEAQAIEEIPGAEALALTPSMRGDKRVAIRFNLAARKAADAASQASYLDKTEATDNLRWSLTGGGAAPSDDKPLGRLASKSEIEASDSVASSAAADE